MSYVPCEPVTCEPDICVLAVPDTLESAVGARTTFWSSLTNLFQMSSALTPSPSSAKQINSNPVNTRNNDAHHS